MFDDYEKMTCGTCEKEFMGPRPGVGVAPLCRDCVSDQALDIVTTTGVVPKGVWEETFFGRGDEDED